MQLSFNLKKYISSVIATSIFVFSSHAVAGGFQLWEQDVSGTGDYHAGAAAEGNIAASEFYNPAQMTLIKKPQISTGVAVIDLGLNYTGRAQSELGTVNMTNVSGGTTNYVPNFHFVTPLPHNLSFGFGLTTPFGLSTAYPDQSPVNVIATTTQLSTINLNPSIAYAVNPHLSLGVGFDEMYGQAVYDGNTFTNYWTRMDGWAPGYNAGALYQFTPQTRLGVSYRSEITVGAKGPSYSNYVIGGAPLSSQANASLTLPPTTIATIYHDFNTRFSMMATAFYTQWSVFHNLTINNMAAANGPTSITMHENYQNTWNLSLGGKYHFSKIYALEAGVGHDQTPTQTGYRDIRLPDANRWAAALGLDIHPTEGFWVSMGWTHFFVPTALVDNTKSTSAPIALAVGNVNASINVYGVQLSMTV